MDSVNIIFISEAASCQFLSVIREKLAITTAYLLKLRFILCGFFCREGISCLSLVNFYRLKGKINFYVTLFGFFKNSGYTLFQLFQYMIAHGRSDLFFIFKISKMIYRYSQSGITYLEGNSGFLWSVLWSTILPWSQVKFEFCKSHN